MSSQVPTQLRTCGSLQNEGMTGQLLHHATHLLLLLLPLVGHKALRGLPRPAQRLGTCTQSLQVHTSIRNRSTQAALQALRVRTCAMGKETSAPSLVCKTPTLLKPVLWSDQTLHDSDIRRHITQPFTSC